MRIDVYHHFVTTKVISTKLDEVLTIVKDIQRKEEAMSQELDDLTAQVQANTDVENSAILLIQGIAAQLIAIKEDPA